MVCPPSTCPQAVADSGSPVLSRRAPGNPGARFFFGAKSALLRLSECISKFCSMRVVTAAMTNSSRMITVRQLGFLFACILLGFMAYWPGLSAPFIFDSTPAIRDNPLLRFQTFGFDEWYSAALSGDTGPLKRPLAMLTFSVNAAISGAKSSFPFNLTNLLLHCFNAGLVFLCVVRLYACAPYLSGRTDARGRQWIGLIAAAVFLLHPINLPAVLHTVQRMAQLSFTFVLLAVAVYLPRRKQILEHGFDAKLIVDVVSLVSLCTILGALAKENALLTPWLLLVIELVFFRFHTSGQLNRRFRSFSLLTLLAPLVGLALYLLLVRPELIPGMFVNREFTLLERLLTQGKILWLYLYWMIVPSASMGGLHHDDMEISRALWEPVTAMAVGAWAAIVVLLAPACIRRYPLVVFAFAWYLVAHVMESSILPLEMVYEHRNYAAMLGFLVLLGDALWSFGRGERHQLVAVCVAVLLAVLVIPLAFRASLWGDEMALAGKQLEDHPDSLRSRYHFANLHLRMADTSSDPAQQKRAVLVAEHYYRRMLELDPQDLVALVTLLYMDGKYLGGTGHASLYQDLLTATRKRVLSPTDYNALVFFKDCSVRRYCAGNDHEYALMVDSIASRNDVSPGLAALMRATYLADAAHDPAGAASVLRGSPLQQPHQLTPYQLLTKWHLQSGDVPGAIDSLRMLYAHDKWNSQLVSLRRATDSIQALP